MTETVSVLVFLCKTKEIVTSTASLPVEGYVELIYVAVSDIFQGLDCVCLLSRGDDG